MFQMTVFSGVVVQAPTTNEFKNAKVCNASLACIKKYKRDGVEKESKVTIKVSAWGSNAAELASAQLGDYVQVVGELANRNYKNKSGIEVWYTEIVAKEVLISRTAAPGASVQQPQQELSLDEIPF